MDEELEVLTANHTWDLVPRPSNTSIIGSKWVYTIKDKPGSIMVAQGYKQEYEIDYKETFVPVARWLQFKLVAIASCKQWSLYQLDVKNAFLHGHLKEIVYVECPPNYSLGDSNVICKLNKSLYGLKQAPWAWIENFHSTICSAGFQQSSYDYSLFTRPSSHNSIILLLYVHDMVIAGSDP